MSGPPRYAILTSDQELKKQCKARQVYKDGMDRELMMKALAGFMSANNNSPIITHCKLAQVHCLVVTNSMKPTQLIWGFHGSFSNAWAFMSFAQICCCRAATKRIGVCVVLPFGVHDLSAEGSQIKGKQGPHVWVLDKQDGAAVDEDKTQSKWRRFMKDPSKSLRESSLPAAGLMGLVSELQQSIDISCASLRIPDNKLSIVGFDQGAVIAQELLLHLRTPPMFTALWGTMPHDLKIINTWPKDVKVFRTKSTQILLCHGETDEVSPLKPIYDMREQLNSFGYKTLCFTINKGHEVPDPVQKVTIYQWIERVEKMNLKGHPIPPKIVAAKCARIPVTDERPVNSEQLSNNLVHTSHTLPSSSPSRGEGCPPGGSAAPPVIDKKASKREKKEKKDEKKKEKKKAPAPGAAGVVNLGLAAQRTAPAESEFVKSLNIALETPSQFSYSTMVPHVKGKDYNNNLVSQMNNPALFTVDDSMAFGINSIWDPKGFQVNPQVNNAGDLNFSQDKPVFT